MDGQDADAVSLCTLDGLGTYRLVPFAYKRVDIGRLVLTELSQLVEESTDVTTLVGQRLKLEDSEQPFGQFVEGELQQFFLVLDKGVGQQRAEGLVLSEQLVVGSLLAQYCTVV